MSVKRITRLFALLIVALVAVQSALPAHVISAATSKTITITETEINQSKRVTNPTRYTVSNVYFDLQPGQVVVTATYTPRNSALPAYATSSTWSLAVVSGRIEVTLVSATSNGKALPKDLLAAINAGIKSGVRAAITNYLRQNFGFKYTVQSLSIGADPLTVVVSK
jgi:hypothetical protein